MCKEARARKPLIHCITNPIAMNQSANAVLALGARPIMAEHPLEVEEITATANALLLNFGNISDVRMESMKRSLIVANETGIPAVIDVVGVACSGLRRQFFSELMKVGKVSVIKGNYSEIMALYDADYQSSGVDAGGLISSEEIKTANLQLSNLYGAIIVATGQEDVITFNGESIFVTGGCDQLSMVTGTGCMLGAIIATFMAFEHEGISVIKACEFFKLCGEQARTDKGNGTFMVNLLDRIGEWNGF